MLGEVRSCSERRRGAAVRYERSARLPLYPLAGVPASFSSGRGQAPPRGVYRQGGAPSGSSVLGVCSWRARPVGTANTPSRRDRGAAGCWCQESLARFGRERGRVLGRDGWRQKERRPSALAPPRPRRREKHGAFPSSFWAVFASTDYPRDNPRHCGAKCSRPRRKRTLTRRVNSNNNAWCTLPSRAGTLRCTADCYARNRKYPTWARC
jgi:hypothetical protein